MTLTFRKSSGQLFCRMSLIFGYWCFLVIKVILYWQENHRSVAPSQWAHDVNVNSGHLVMVDFTKCLHYKITIFSFISCGKTSCFSSLSDLLILASIDGPKRDKPWDATLITALLCKNFQWFLLVYEMSKISSSQGHPVCSKTQSTFNLSFSLFLYRRMVKQSGPLIWLNSTERIWTLVTECLVSEILLILQRPYIKSHVPFFTPKWPLTLSPSCTCP